MSISPRSAKIILLSKLLGDYNQASTYSESTLIILLSKLLGDYNVAQF